MNWFKKYSHRIVDIFITITAITFTLLIEGKFNDENLLEADIDNWYDSPVPNIQEALSSLGIKTTAKTIKGLTNVVNKLDGENYSKFLKYLGLT